MIMFTLRASASCNVDMIMEFGGMALRRRQVV
jgi:hypothetical protein